MNNIQIKTLFTVIGMILVSLTILAAYYILELYQHSSNLKLVEHDRHLMISKADELRQSSDDLTRFARTYVITADKKYKDVFFKILDIRNGKAPKPKEYTGIYWDLSKPLRTSRHPDSEIISLKESMNQLPYNKYEFEKLSEAEFNSNDLVNLEVEAFNAMIGLYKDSDGHYTIKRNPDQQLAISLLHSIEYHNAKEKIMLPIDEFLTSLDERTRSLINDTNAQIELLFKKLFSIFAIGFILYFFTFLIIQKKILVPITLLTNTISAFKNGEKNIKVFDSYSDEIGQMTQQFFVMKENIDEAHNNLEKVVKQRTESLEKSRMAAISVTADLNNQRKELEVLKSNLETANKKLKDLDKLKSMFIASMSHELRTPLNAIIGFTGVVLDGMSGSINEIQKDQLTRVKKAGKHLLSLISDVIDISKIEAGRVSAEIEEFLLSEIIDDAKSEMEGIFKTAGLSIVIDMPEDFKLNTDKRRLYQCILNYLSNAAKFTEKEGDVILKVENFDESVNISVIDNGVGITKEDQSKLFEAFERLESHLRVKAGGTGLGLYLTKRITENILKGSVWVKSEVDKGSTFGLNIPKIMQEDKS